MKKKKRRKHQKDDSSDPSLMEYSDSSGVSYICVVYVYNDCHQTNQNHCSKMVGRVIFLMLTPLFLLRGIIFFLLSSLMTMIPKNQMTTVQGPGSLLVRAFHHVLNYPLIESFYFRLVELFLIESQYSCYFGLTFPAQILL